jgi:predicted Fe-Mo cluster-binding NifX family protein
MMKIAIPVKDESLSFVGNAGHTPKFAIYEQSGGGMFKTLTMVGIIDNPRSDLDHDDHDDEHHECNHGHDDAEHIAQHDKMGVVLDGCDYLIVKRACKNTVNAMKPFGVKILKYNGNSNNGLEILKELSAKFI